MPENRIFDLKETRDRKTQNILFIYGAKMYGS
jgi:hypothetical protein